MSGSWNDRSTRSRKNSASAIKILKMVQSRTLCKMTTRQVKQNASHAMEFYPLTYTARRVDAVFFAPSKIVDRVIDRSEARRQKACTHAGYKRLPSHGNVLTIRKHTRSYANAETKQSNSSCSQIRLPSYFWILFYILLISISLNSCSGTRVNTHLQHHSHSNPISHLT